MKIAPSVYRACATLLAALLGQGLIYLCIVDRMHVGTAIALIVALAAVVIAAAALARSAVEARLVRDNAPPEYLYRRLRAQPR
jgi:hypothetical protein